MNNNFGLDLSAIPNELTLLLELINLEETNEEIHTSIIKSYESINWNLFVDLALHHRVYPILYTKIKGAPNNLVPKFVIQVIAQYYKRNTFQMLYLSSEMEKINELCKKNDIRLLFLKGPILASELYGDVSLRTSSDLDILVPINDLEKMESLLTTSGYVKDDYIETILSDWKWRHHHVTYIHPKKDVKVEVHWRLNPGPAKEPSFNKLWDRKSISLLTTRPIYYLGKEDLFLFLVTHGARHGWSRLRWLMDIRYLVQQEINWGSLHKLLKRHSHLHIGGQALLLSSQLLATEIDEGMKLIVKGNQPRMLAEKTVFYLERMVNLHTYPVPDYIAKYHKRYLYNLMAPQQKVFFILSFLYPYPDDAKTLPLPKKIHFLYFPLRPFLWAWRKTRKLDFHSGDF